MQSMAKSAAADVNRPAKLTVLKYVRNENVRIAMCGADYVQLCSTLAYVYKSNGFLGLYRGVTPRIGLGE